MSRLKPILVVLGLAVLLIATIGCDLGGGKKAAKQAFKDFQEVEAIARVGVDPKAYEKVLTKAQTTARDALGQLGEGDLRNAVQDVLDTYTDAKVVVDTPGELKIQGTPFEGLASKYSLRAPSPYIPQFALLKKIFDRGKSALKTLGDQVR